MVTISRGVRVSEGTKNKTDEGTTKTKFTVKPKQGRKLLEQGEWLIATFEGAKEYPSKQEGWNPFLVWSFKITKGYLDDGETSAVGEEIGFFSQVDIRPGNNTHWIASKIIDDPDLDEDDDIDVQEFIGKKYKVMIEHTIKKSDSKVTLNTIKMVKKLKLKKKASPDDE